MHIISIPSLKKIDSHLFQLLHGNEMMTDGWMDGQTDGQTKLIYPDFFFEKAGHKKSLKGRN